MADKARYSMDRPFPFPLPIGLFHLDGGDAGGSGDGGSGDGGDGGSGDGAGGGAERTFTQADVDRIVKDRVARVKNTPPADYDDLKAKAAKFDELEAANQTELEKAQARAETAERERQAAQDEARQVMVRSAILAEAAKADRSIHDPSMVADLLMGQVEIVDGKPANVSEAMDALLEAKPFLVATGDDGAADQHNRTGGVKQVTESELQNMSPEQIVAARREGRLVALGVGGGKG